MGMTDGADTATAETRARQRAGGVYLRQLREGAEITRSELAEQLLSVTEAYMADVEAGHIRLPAEDIASWASALGLPRERLAEAIGRHYDPLPFDPLWSKAAA